MFDSCLMTLNRKVKGSDQQVSVRRLTSNSGYAPRLLCFLGRYHPHGCHGEWLVSNQGLWLWLPLLSRSILIPANPSLSLGIYTVKCFMSECSRKLCQDHEIKKHCRMFHCYVWKMPFPFISGGSWENQWFFKTHLRHVSSYRLSCFLFGQRSDSPTFKSWMTLIH